MFTDSLFLRNTLGAGSGGLSQSLEEGSICPALPKGPEIKMISK
jgi:hypothetical protein